METRLWQYRRRLPSCGCGFLDEEETMSLDAIAVSELVCELSAALTGAKIDKIYQPEKDEITLALRSREGNHKLLLSASATSARGQLTHRSFDNPASAPNFCMLLRRRLAGGRITAISQPGFERVIDFSVESYTELGDLTLKHLILEIMGRYSNLILTEQDGRILDSIKRIDASTSSRRQILPGLTYELPPQQDKISPLTVADGEVAGLLAGIQSAQRCDKWVMGTFAGLSPIVAREVCHRAGISSDAAADSLSHDQKQGLYNALTALFARIRTGDYAPCVVYDAATGKPVDFAAIPIAQYGSAARVEPFATLSEAAEAFYTARDTAERQKQRAAGLTHTVKTNLERCQKKILLLHQSLQEARDKDQYKRKADLLTANLYRIRQGDRSVRVEDFYAQPPEEVSIELDVSLTPQQNAQRYYRRYTKAKTTETEAARQLALAEAELSYLQSVQSNLELAQSPADLKELRDELIASGYLARRSREKGRRTTAKPQPLHFVSSDGFDIFVGKNNVQNDFLTLRFANSGDWWFHTKNIPGSHTVIKLGTDKQVSERTLLEAAALAAYHSSAKEGANIPVDYTQIKNVKKPAGAKPGMVIYDRYNTLYVTPDADLVHRLSAAATLSTRTGPRN